MDQIEAEEQPDIDLVDIYLEDVRRCGVLTAEQEMELLQKVEAGKEAARQLEDLGFHDVKSWVRLIRRWRVGQEARNRFLDANLRHVITTARKCSESYGVDVLDLIQEGNLGLIRALEKYDWRKGAKFTRYASRWISQFIYRYIDNHATSIRIPVHKRTMVRKYEALRESEYKKSGKPPTVEEIERVIKEEAEEIHRVWLLQESVWFDEPLVEEHYAKYLDTDLFDPDNPIEIQEPLTVGFVLEADSIDPLDYVEEQDIYYRLKAKLAQVPNREAEILVLRFGLDGREPQTLESIGQQFNLTRERIRQLEKMALCRLRHPSLEVRICFLELDESQDDV